MSRRDVSSYLCTKNGEATRLFSFDSAPSSHVQSDTVDCDATTSASASAACGSSSSSSQHCLCADVRVLVKERDDLKAQLDRIQEELAVTSREKHQSAEFGLQLLDQKDELQKRFDDLEHAYDATRSELEAVRRALCQSLTSHKVSATTGIEQEEKLLKESAKKDATFACTLAELEKELKSLRCELDRVQSEKENLLAEHCDMTKQLDLHEWERKSIRSELKDLKIRESRLLQELNEIEDENISLRKQVSTLRSSQIEFDLAKDQILHLQDELELRKLQLEEYESLKNIAEKQMLEALEALECEREEKYELRKQLDQRMHFDCALGSLGLRFSSSSHASDKYLKDSSNFTLHSSVTSSSAGKDEQFIVVDEKSENKSERSRSSCISSSSFTYFDGKMNCIRNSFLNLHRSKHSGDTNSRCMSSDVLASSMNSAHSSVSSNCILPNVTENSNKHSDTFLREKNDKNYFNRDKYIHGIDKCQVNSGTINESLFACKLTCSSSLTSVTLTSGNSSGTPNSSLSVTPASTCCSSYINSPDSSPSLYSRSDSTSNSSTSPTAIVSTAPIVTSEIVEKSSLSTSDQSDSRRGSGGETSSTVYKGVSTNTSNTNSRHNSFESCESNIGNNDSSSTSSYHTCHSSNATAALASSCPCKTDRLIEVHQIKVPESSNCNKVCHLPCREMSSSLSSDICSDNKSAGSTDGKDNTVYVSVADATLIDTVDYIRSDSCYFTTAPSSNGNDDRKSKCLSSNVDTDDKKRNCRNDDHLILQCVSNGDSVAEMSNCISIEKTAATTSTQDACTSHYCGSSSAQCYSMSTSTSLLASNQSLTRNNETVNTGARNLSQVNEVISTNDTSVNNYSPSIDTNNKCIVSSAPSADSTDFSANDNTLIDKCNLQQEKQLEALSNSAVSSHGAISCKNNQTASKDDVPSTILLKETDVSVAHNIHPHQNTDSDIANSLTGGVQRPKSLMTGYSSRKSFSNELLDNLVKDSPDSLAHSSDYLARRLNKDCSTGQVFNSKSSNILNQTVPVIDCNYKATSVMQSTGNDKLATSSAYHQHHTESISEVSKNMASCFPSKVNATSLAAGAAFSSFSASPSTGDASSCIASSSSFNNLPSTKYSLRQSNSDYLLSNVYSSHSQVTCNLYPFSSEQLNSSYINRKSNAIRSFSIANCKDGRFNQSNGCSDHGEPANEENGKMKQMTDTKDNTSRPYDSFIDHTFQSNMTSSHTSSPRYLNHSSSIANCIDINRKCAKNMRALTCSSRSNHHKTTLRSKSRLISHNRCQKRKLIHQFRWLSCSTLQHDSYVTMAPSVKRKRRLSMRNERANYRTLSFGNSFLTRHGTDKLMNRRHKNYHQSVASEPDHLCALDSEHVNSRYASLDHSYKGHFFIGNLNNSLDSSQFSSLESASTSGSGNSSIDCNHGRHHSSTSSSINSLKVLNCERGNCNEIQYARIIPRSERSKRSINDVKLCLMESNKLEDKKSDSTSQLLMKSNVIAEKSVIHIDHTSDGSLFNDKRNTSQPRQSETVTAAVATGNSSAKVLIHRSEVNENTTHDGDNKSSVNCGISKRLNRTNEMDNNCLSFKSSTRNDISTGYDTCNSVSSSKIKSKLPAIATIYSHDLDKIDRFDSVYASNSAIDVSNASVKLNKYMALSDSFHDNLTNNADADEEISGVVDTGTIYHTIPATEALLSTAQRKSTDLCVSSQSTSRSNVCLAALKATVRALAGCFLGLFAP